jgi:hypothetical protein
MKKVRGISKLVCVEEWRMPEREAGFANNTERGQLTPDFYSRDTES